MTMNRSRPSRPLGGGLGAVIRSQLPPGVEALANARTIDVARLSPNPFQPRRTFDPQALAELAASIRADGVLQPLLVRPDPAREGYYQIGAGERRWQAARRAELAAVPCLVRDLSDDDMERLALVENIQRDDLSPLDEARAYRRIMGRLGLSMRTLSEQLGKSHMYVENRLKLLSDPRLEAAVERGALGSTVAQEMATLDEGARAALLDRAERGERIRVKDVQAWRAPEAQEPPNNLAAAPLVRATTEEPSMTEPTVGAPNNLAASPSPNQVDDDAAGRDQGRPQPRVPSTPPLPPATGERHPPEAADVKETVDPGRVRLRDLRIIQLHTGRDGEPRQLDTADRATVLRILRADLAWLEGIDRRAPGE